MEKTSIPEGYQTVMPYLIIKDATKFFNFAKVVFGATEKYKVLREENILMHGEIQIGESVIMFADSTDEFATQTAAMFVYVPDADESYNKALQEGGAAKTPMSDQSYGRTGGITDPFGNVWWITSVKK